jgi:CRISPR-associated protein Csb2
MVFGHVPKEKNGGEPAVILDSLHMIGRKLPGAAVEIAVSRHSPLHGVPPSWQFKPRPESDSGEQPAWMLRHVTLRFNRDVRGPLVLGRMRYFGLGLMQPMEERAWQD